MQLYYSPGACSLSTHIILREAGYPFELEKVDLGSKKTAAGDDYTKINPKGYVPALKLDDGRTLTENIAIDEYLADHRKESGLAPPAGTFERYKLVEWLAFISTELHKQFGPLFKPDTPEQTKNAQKELIRKRLGYVAEQLQNKQYVTGEFSVADAYLFVILRWAEKMHIDVSQWPALDSYVKRMNARPQVVAALKAEGLS